MKKLEIVLTDQKSAYTAGETVNGKVRIYFERNIKCKYVYIICRGEFVMAAGSDNAVYICILNDEKTLYVKDEHNKGLLLGGRWHEFEFTHRIPDVVPPSLKFSPYNYVRYSLKAVITKSFFYIKTEKLEFTVVNQLDLDSCKDYDKPTSFQVTKTYGGYGCTGGDITAKLWSDRRWFIPGDEIQFYYTVQNASQQRLTSATLKLLMEAKYSSPGDKWRPFGKMEILTTSLDCLKFTNESFSRKEMITVPQILPTYYSGWVLEIRYYIQLSLGISGSLFSLDVKLPIGIGTKHPSREGKLQV